MSSPRKSRGAAFTLLELVTAVVVVLILVVISLPIFQQMQRRLDRTHCINNLRSLHTAVNLYLQDHRRVWPQIAAEGDDPTVAANAWLTTLEPYGATQGVWICPTEQRNLGAPDLTNKENVRVDYTTTPFDRNPDTPMRYPSQPWFIETNDVHGNGSLLMFPDGHVGEVGDYRNLFQSAKSSGGGGKSPSPPPH